MILFNRLNWFAPWAIVLMASSAFGADIVVEENVRYATIGDVDLMLDIARPVGDGPFPAIAFIHGGGWFQGNRQIYRSHIEQAANRGYAAFAISYRLMKFDEAKKETTTAKGSFPTAVHDVKAAIRWIRANAEKYHVDPNRIGATGASAGGHLSLMLGMTDKSAGLEGDGGNLDQSSRVQAVVNVFGPTEMASGYRTSSVAWIFRLFLDGTPEEQPERYKVSSPVTYISKDDPPVLTLHGDKDLLVSIDQGRLLDQKMKEAGAYHTLVILKGQGHGFDAENQKAADKATWDFFDQHLKKPAKSVTKAE